MRIWRVVLSIVLAFATTICAADLTVDYESRTSVDKTNLFYRTNDFEVYVLKNNNLEIEVGPRLYFGPVRWTTRLGGVWNLADSTVNPFMATTLFLKHGRFTALGVFEFNLEGSSLINPQIKWSYQEGFAMVDLDGLVPHSSIGINFEHYKKNGEEVWVVGPRYNYSVKKGYFESISLWAGVTDNPTAAIFLNFKIAD